jgi:hypothetical protein
VETFTTPKGKVEVDHTPSQYPTFQNPDQPPFSPEYSLPQSPTRHKLPQGRGIIQGGKLTFPLFHKGGNKWRGDKVERTLSTFQSIPKRKPYLAPFLPHFAPFLSRDWKEDHNPLNLSTLSTNKGENIREHWTGNWKWMEGDVKFACVHKGLQMVQWGWGWE